LSANSVDALCRKDDIMTEIILTFPVLSFPVRKATRLSRFWIETGDPAPPLVCGWIARANTDVDPGMR
jgi:hypothetical protein